MCWSVFVLTSTKLKEKHKMANTQRRSEYIDREGNMFIPISVEGGQYNTSFFTTTKLVALIILLMLLFYVIYSLSIIPNPSFRAYLFWIGGYTVIFIQVMRFVVFEEKFYYKMYKQLKQYEISTPATFWKIATIKDTDEGAISTFVDAKIAVIIRMERDTITGKTKEFRETHYDAISDFYREVAVRKYSLLQMNLMEPAGKDPRLAELSKIVYKSDNGNIQKLMELMVGHIKNITHSTLYESDYFMIYTTDTTKIDNIIGDATDAILKLLDGAYVTYHILNSKDINEMVKDNFGVNYFNSTEASLLMYNNNPNYNSKPFNIYGVLWEDGLEQEFDEKEKTKLRNITSGVIKETLSSSQMALKKTFYRDRRKENIGVDLEKITGGTFDFDFEDENELERSLKNQVNIEEDEEYIDF